MSFGLPNGRDLLLRFPDDAAPVLIRRIRARMNTGSEFEKRGRGSLRVLFETPVLFQAGDFGLQQ